MKFFLLVFLPSAAVSSEEWSPQKLMRLSIRYVPYFCRNPQMPHISQMPATEEGQTYSDELDCFTPDQLPDELLLFLIWMTEFVCGI